MSEHLKSLKNYWNSLTAEQGGESAVALNKEVQSSDLDFHLYGMRIAEQLVDLFKAHGATHINHSSLLEIGCGMGRFLKPFSHRFQSVYGIDISDELIGKAKVYCKDHPNVHLILGNGWDLSDFKDGQLDYCFSGGVFQHITDYKIIENYIREAFRVLKVGGTFLMVFQIWMTQETGEGRVGAKITADKLEQSLKEIPYSIKELLIDPKDHIPHMIAVLRKEEASVNQSQNTFSNFKVTNQSFRTGIFEDLPTYSHYKKLWEKGPRPITFYDK